MPACESVECACEASSAEPDAAAPAPAEPTPAPAAEPELETEAETAEPVAPAPTPEEQPAETLPEAQPETTPPAPAEPDEFDDLFSSPEPAAEEKAEVPVPAPSDEIENAAADEGLFASPETEDASPVNELPQEPAAAQPQEPAADDEFDTLFGPKPQPPAPAPADTPAEDPEESPSDDLFSSTTPTAPSAISREWTDRSGRFTVSASMLRAAAGRVYLQGEDGHLWAVDVARLSDNDLAYVQAELSMLQARKHPVPAMPISAN